MHTLTIELTGNYQDVDNSNFSFILQSGGNGIGRLYNWLITFKNVPSGERSVYLELFNLNNNEDAPQNIFIKNGSVLSGQTVSLGYVDLSGTVEL